MSRKITTLVAMSLMVGLFIFTSCSDDDDNPAKPEISDMEVGTSNSHTGIVGSDLHTQATVVAEAKIDDIIVEINKKSGEGWQFDTTFTEFANLKNTTYHKHIDIPSTADTGAYTFTFTVTDMEGQQSVDEEDLNIQYPSDSIAPVITVTSAPSSNQTFSNGNTITIEGNVTDETALGGIYIGLVRVDQNLSNSEVNETNTITILHNHDFDNPELYSFSASIVVGAEQDNNITPKDLTGDVDYAWQSASYYIVVKSKDSYGGNWGFSDQYPIIINY